MYSILFGAGLGIIGFLLGKQIDDDLSSKKVSGTPLADDADSVPSSVSADSDTGSESSDKPQE
jgi:hypothetical protein